MDFLEVDEIMTAKSLATNPAFDNLHILIEPIPPINGCPLGLYYPDTATVILPLDATEGALLHELGHRHGHYYYNDLTERYAEDFRMRYQKGRTLLYSGNNFASLPKFGALFEEGEKGAVEIALLQAPTPDELYAFKSQLNSYGETAPKVFYGNSDPFIRVEFTKGVDWMVIIAGILSGTIAATAGMLGYGVYKLAKEFPWVFPLTLVGIVAGFTLYSAYKKEWIKIG